MGQHGTFIDYKIFGANEITTWPQQTDLCCWNDGKPFDTVPIPLPFTHNEATQTFEVAGVFCSVGCAKRYSMDSMGYRHGLQTMWIGILCDRLFGDATLADVFAAPPRNTLAHFGGHLDLATYRSGQYNGRVELLSRPMISYPIVAHIKPTTGQQGQVLGLRRPMTRGMHEDEMVPVDTDTIPGLLSTYNPDEATETKTDTTMTTRTESEPIRRSARVGGGTATGGGGLTKFLRKPLG